MRKSESARLTSVDGLMAPREATVVESMKAHIDPRIAIWTAVAALVNVGAALCWFKVQQKMPESQLFSLHFSSIVCIIPLFLVVYIRAQWFESIDERMPHKLILMGIGSMLACSQFFGTLTAPHITHPLQTVLVDGALPLTLLLSILIVNARYRWHQYVALLVAIIALAITLIPRFDGTQFDVSLPWELLYLSAILAVSLQLVGQQWSYQDSPEMWVSYMVAWQTFGQALTLSALAPFESLHGFGTQDDVADIPPHYWSTLKCVFRYQEDVISTDCSDVWPYMTGWIVLGLAAVITNAKIVKMSEPAGSLFGALLWTFCFVAYNITRSWSWLLGDIDVLEPNYYNYIALGMMAVSMTVFRWWSHTMTEEAERQAAALVVQQDKQQVVRRRQSRHAAQQQSNVQQHQHRRGRSSGGSSANSGIVSGSSDRSNRATTTASTNGRSRNKSNEYQSITIRDVSAHDDQQRQQQSSGYGNNNNNQNYYDDIDNNGPSVASGLLDLPSFDDSAASRTTPLLGAADSSSIGSSTYSPRSGSRRSTQKKSRRSRRQRQSSDDDDHYDE